MQEFQRFSLVYPMDANWFLPIEYALHLNMVRHNITASLAASFESSCDLEKEATTHAKRSHKPVHFAGLMLIVLCAGILALAAKFYYYCRVGRRKRKQLQWNQHVSRLLQFNLVSVGEEDEEKARGEEMGDACARPYSRWSDYGDNAQGTVA